MATQRHMLNVIQATHVNQSLDELWVALHKLLDLVLAEVLHINVVICPGLCRPCSWV